MASIQPTSAERSSGAAHPSARASEVPRHRELQPRRVLHEADRRPQATGCGRRQRGHGGWAYANTADRRLPRVHSRPRSGHWCDLPRASRRARTPRNRRLQLAGVAARPAGMASAVLYHQHLSAGDAARDGPGSPVSVHLKPVAESAGLATTSGRPPFGAGPGEGAGRFRRTPFPQGGRKPVFRAARGRHGTQSRRLIPGHDGRELRHLPRHTQRRAPSATRSARKTCSR